MPEDEKKRMRMLHSSRFARMTRDQILEHMENKYGMH